MTNLPYTSTSLSNWLANIKADDIDGGLAADFDGSLSGLGVELGTATYNMSEALLALPVFKQEMAIENARNLQHTVAHEAFTCSFQYILGAPTSPATKVYEDTLTYLNQGQSYELKIKKSKDLGPLRGKCLRSIIRVMFHERRLQYNEKEQLDFWMMMRPGERIVDVDVPLSYGITEIKIDKNKLNCVEFIWDPQRVIGLFIKIHAISTEFTPKKHGGEKGVPFRLQVETYIDEDYNPRLLYAGSCQIKVFKPKGADRKHKTDLMKLEKRSDSEKDKYQPSYECTVLTEIPTDQVKHYLEEMEKEDNRVHQTIEPSPQLPSRGSVPNLAQLTLGSKTDFQSELSTVGDLTALLNQENSDDSEISLKNTSDGCDSTNPVAQVTPLSPKATAQEVTQWLHQHRFSSFVKVFQSFSGADLLRLSREDLIQICGLANGIRLNNALQSRRVRPKLTIYIFQPRESPPTEKMRRSASLTCCNESILTSFHGCLSSNMSGSQVAQSDKGNTCNMQDSFFDNGMSFITQVKSGPTDGDHGGIMGDIKRSGSITGKRQYREEPETGDDDSHLNYTKKQKTRCLELARKGVYHAVYLENLTVQHMKMKLAETFCIDPVQIADMNLQLASGIQIHITDSVVQNFKDETRFTVLALEDESMLTNYNMLLVSSA